MSRFPFPVAGAALTLFVAGCVAPTSGGPPRPQAPTAPPSFNPAGLQSVLGHTAKALEKAFGAPDLDIREGSARKLQFSSAVCVLDTYLYPPARGGDPIVTYIDARLPDGRDIDRASCVAALEKRREKR
ncbi:hypothetical protein [Allosphingosinicella humi]